MILARKYFGKKIFNRIFAVTVGLAEVLQRGWTGRHSLLVKNDIPSSLFDCSYPLK